MGDEPAEEREVRRDALHDGLRERRLEPFERLVAVVAERDQLGDHRVVARADLVAFLDARVDADVRRQPEAAHGAGLRQERPRVLRVQARLDRVTVRRRLEPGEGLAVRDTKLELDEIEAGHRLGDRVLDLDPAVQLEEEDGVALDEELGRAGALVSRARARRRRRARRSAPGAPATGPEAGTPRRPSGGAAAPSSRALPARAPSRGGRPSAAPRRAAGFGGSARSRPSRHRRRPRPRAPRTRGRRPGRPRARRPASRVRLRPRLP